jgi:hypothetical protein
MKKDKLSRAEQTKAVRRILSKNDVDMGEIQISCSGARITLSGTLVKRSGDDFIHEALSNMHSQLEKFGRVSSELTNWDLNGGVRSTEKNRVTFSQEVEEEEEVFYDE